jgi:hypothetical protein
MVVVEISKSMDELHQSGDKRKKRREELNGAR